MESNDSAGTHGFAPRLGWLVAGCLALILLVFGSRVVPSIAFDPARMMVPAEQFRIGKSTGLFNLRHAVAEDLSIDRETRMSFWAPGYTAIPYAVLRMTGTDWGTAFHWLVLVGWPLAIVGWTWWFWLAMPRARVWLGWFLAIFLLFRGVCGGFSTYDGGDWYAFSLSPWYLLLNLAAARMTGARGIALAALGGALAAGIFLLKYSLIIVSMGVGAWWLVECYYRREEWKKLAVWLMTFGVCFVTIRASGVPGGPTPATTIFSLPTDVFGVVEYIGLFAIAVVDLHPPLNRVFFFPPGKSLLPMNTEYLFGMVLVVGWALIAWVARGRIAAWYRANCRGEYASLVRLAIAVGAAHWGVLGIFVVLGSHISKDPRHFVVPAYAVLPLLVELSYRVAASSPFRGVRIAIAGGWLAAVGVAAAFGTLFFADKIVLMRTFRPTSVSPLGYFAHDLTTPGGVQSFRDEVKALKRSDKTALVITSAIPAIELAEHRIFLFDIAATLGVADMPAQTFHGNMQDGVMVVFPTDFDDPADGRGAEIRRRFPDVAHWNLHTLRSEKGWSVLSSY